MNPLEQLRDIHQPPPPGWWPPGPGWWLVIILVLCAALAAAWCWRRQLRRRAYRRAAIAELRRLDATARGESPSALLALVRRTARAGRADCGWPALPARDLLARLDSSCQNRMARELAENGSDLEQLAQSQYWPDPSTVGPGAGAVLRRWCQWWIRHHREADLC